MNHEDPFENDLVFTMVNELFHRKDKDELDMEAYSYFRASDQAEASPILKKILRLCSVKIISDAMGADKYLFNIFGLTPKDLYQLSPHEYQIVEDRVHQMREEHNAEMEIRTQELNKKRNLIDPELNT